MSFTRASFLLELAEPVPIIELGDSLIDVYVSQSYT